jgi:pantoate--beta-alanine ligase
MGALHDGHASLIAIGHEVADRVVVSIFVNPLQFDRPDDFSHYPRPLEEDLALCESLGVDAVYTPTAATLYPEGFDTVVRAGALASRFEGEARPGHFDGVTTVVAKLFGAVRPDLAVFGRKDFQQLAVIKRMTSDLDLGIEIVAAPTVREGDGLALSSRNRRLSAEQRAVAAAIPRALSAAHHAVEDGARRVEDILSPARAILAHDEAISVDYLAMADVDSLEPIERFESIAVILVAVFVGDVRLIDNIEITVT